MSKRPYITQERLKELLNYDPETGIFTWRITRTVTKAGDIAGCLDRRGYWQIKLDMVAYRAHRLAWLYVTGRVPTNFLDHINGNFKDNRIANLREATAATNAQNRRRPRKGAKSGFFGVSKSQWGYVAQIGINGEYIHLGSYKTGEQAAAAYLAAKRKYHPYGTL